MLIFVSGNLWSCLKEVKPLVVYDGEWRIAMKPVQWNRATSQIDSYGDINVLLDLGACSWGLSGVPLSKSRLLTCLIGNTELLCMQCRGIMPHFSARGKSHGFSRVATGTWGTFSSYGGKDHSKLVFVKRHQDSCPVMMDTSGI